MKNVILYVRVSTEEQAIHGFSLNSQKELLTQYAIKQGWNILKVFTDDYSAWKGFDRPGYNLLKKFIQENKKSVNAILFTQWSRFSRDYTEAAVEIRRLKDLNIEPNAIEQWIDFSIPENLYLLVMYITAPQVENDRLSQRTKAGNRQALKQGRWLWKAPFGYDNNRLLKRIEINESKAPLVKASFELMSTGIYNAEEVRKKVFENGMTLTKQAFLNMLQNHVYIGKIKIPAFKDEPESFTYGIHEPIIAEDLFNSVQLVLNGKKKPNKGLTKNTELPLVGNLYCPICDKPMTGSGSRGNGGIYHYYHCQRKYGCKNNINANTANEEFVNYLRSFEPDEEAIELYRMILEDVFDSNSANREAEKKSIEKQIEIIDKRIQTAIDKNLDGIWDDKTYIKQKELLESQKSELVMKHFTLKNMKSEFKTYFNYSTSLLSNLSGYYQMANTATKKKIVSSIFPEKIYFEKNKYRTTKINEVLELISNGGKAFKKKSPAKSAGLSSVAPKAGLEPATL